MAVWREVSEHTTRLALRRLIAAYLLISGCALLFPHRPGAWLTLILLHLVGVVLLMQPSPVRAAYRRLVGSQPRVAGVLADWYALALMPFLYLEVATVNAAIYGGRYFDGWIQVWELRLFGGQPSRDLAAACSSGVVSEVLHFFYLSYYLIIFGPPIYLYLRRRIVDHQKVVFALMLAFLGHYLVFIFFPVQGPRYLFPPPGGELSQGIMYRLAHAVLEAGSSRGAAFPSSHVGVAVVQTAMAFLVWRRAAPALVVATVGLGVGAVYGGFHYAIDTVSGLLLGLILFSVGPRVASALGRGAVGDVSAGDRTLLAG
jgi:membrane-associated phospholipid phosphatase